METRRESNHRDAIQLILKVVKERGDLTLEERSKALVCPWQPLIRL